MEEEKNPVWVTMKSAELEKIVVELAKQGETPAKIGIILRDKHGVPKAKLLGKRISQIMKENEIKFKTEKDSLKEKMQKLEQHKAKHKHDYTATRSLTKKRWVLNKIEKLESL